MSARSIISVSFSPPSYAEMCAIAHSMSVHAVSPSALSSDAPPLLPESWLRSASVSGETPSASDTAEESRMPVDSTVTTSELTMYITTAATGSTTTIPGPALLSAAELVRVPFMPPSTIPERAFSSASISM